MTQIKRRPLVAAFSTVLLVLGGLLITSTPAYAANFNVTDAGDNAATVGTLRWAMTQAEATPGPDTITISYQGIIPAGATSLPTINDDVTIVGPGIAKLTLNTFGTAFDITSPVSVDISGMTIKAGLDAVTNLSGGNLTVTDVDSTGTVDGAVRYIGGSAADTVSLTRVTASGSSAEGVMVDMADGTVSLVDVTANGNTTSGIDLVGQGAARLSASNLTTNNNQEEGVRLVAANTSSIVINGLASGNNTEQGVYVNVLAAGASIDITNAKLVDNTDIGLLTNDTAGVRGTLNLHRSVITGNGDVTVPSIGGGIAAYLYGAGKATIDTTTVRANEGASGGIYLQMQGDTNLTLRDSTISGNYGVLAAGGLAIRGGAPGTVANAHLINNTISGNTGYNGGLTVTNTEGDANAFLLEVTNLTVVNNTSSINTAGSRINHATTTIANSIFTDDTGDSDLLSDDPTVTIHHSLVQVPDLTMVAPLAAGAGNLTSIDPDLGPLADNGGATFTHLPNSGSPAIDSGDPAFAGSTTDQRGNARVSGGVVDMGAVEVDAILANTGTNPAVPAIFGGIALVIGALFLGYALRRRARKN